MKTHTNSTYTKQNARLLPATFKRGIINGIHAVSNTADVQIIGSHVTIVKNVPLSSAIDVTTLVVGTKCRIDMFNETNANDMVVAYTYGTNVPSPPFISSGTVSLEGTGLIAYNTIAHGLPKVPQIVLFFATVAPDFSQTFPQTVWQYQPADAANIYLSANSEPTREGSTGTWIAIAY